MYYKGCQNCICSSCGNNFEQYRDGMCCECGGCTNDNVRVLEQCMFYIDDSDIKLWK